MTFFSNLHELSPLELLTKSIILATVASIGYILWLCVYRLYFHPYAKYPGPVLAKVSYLRAFYHAWIRDTQLDQTRLHEIYGPIVRYNPDTISFAKVEALKEIHQVGANLTKGKAYAPMNADPHKANMVFAPSKKEHGRRRRIIGAAFTDGSVRKMMPMILAHIKIFCDKLLEDDGHRVAPDFWSKPKNLDDWLFWLGQDITSDLVVGRSFNLLTSEEMRKASSVMQGGLRRNSLIFQYPGLFRPGINHPLDFGTWFTPSVMAKISQFIGFATSCALARVSEGKTNSSGRQDILQSMIDNVDPETGTNFTPEDIALESNILLLAGGDTVGTALQIIMWYLTRPWNAHVLDKLTHEIRTTFKSESEITWGPALQSCTYLEACMAEGFRSFTGSAFWREAEKGGATVCGEFIPQGLSVGWCNAAINRDPNIFPAPYDFDPERYIAGSKYSAEQVATAKAASHPFLVGPRSCIAKTLAKTIILTTMAMVIYRMDVKMASDEEGGKLGGGEQGMGALRYRKNEYQLYGSFTVAGEGPVLRFKARNGVLSASE